MICKEEIEILYEILGSKLINLFQIIKLHFPASIFLLPQHSLFMVVDRRKDGEGEF